jgi:hypothetical protein
MPGGHQNEGEEQQEITLSNEIILSIESALIHLKCLFQIISVSKSLQRFSPHFEHYIK